MLFVMMLINLFDATNKLNPYLIMSNVTFKIEFCIYMYFFILIIEYY